MKLYQILFTYNYRHLFLLLFVSPIILSQQVSNITTESIISSTSESTNKNSTNDDSEGSICMTVETFHSTSDPGSFYECAPLSDQEITEYKIEQKYLGVWKKRDCPDNFEFDEVKQRCVEKKKLRRQQVACGTVGNPGCASPCQATNNNPQIGTPCNWLTAKLQPDPASNIHFLQCVSQNPGESCGEWVRTPCSPGTAFNQYLQICIPTDLQCQRPNTVPICGCRQSNVGPNCPGKASCQDTVCCQSVQMPLTAIQAAPPMCIGSGAYPISSCDQSCPQNYQCQPQIGCCPQGPTQPIALCPGSGAIPLGSCVGSSSCPSGTMCNGQLGGCCPQNPSIGNSISNVILCPSGTPATQPCGQLNYCPDGLGCFQGACCPLSCPEGQSAQGFCSSNSCSVGNCIKGCCCQNAPQLPVCSNGQKAMVSCVMNNQCGPGYECSNGGCCPRPFCPSGVQASGHCSMLSGCGNGRVCLDNLCCPMPRCNGGALAVRVCTMTANCGSGYDCLNGGCCPRPTCPTGGIAVQRCNSGCSNCCPKGYMCMGNGCCPMPTCSSTGMIAQSICMVGYQCGRGNECVSGGACCPLPKCPSGVQAVQRCQIGSGCPNGQMCTNGVCCPLPICSYTGSVAMSVCGMGNACPVGYICEGMGCCPEPLPLCPNGGRSTQKCIRGSDCPPGFGCTPLGGCCLLSLEPQCPLRQNPICQCSANNVCPSQSTCNMGTCCTSAVATYNLVPGTKCQSANQCNGYSANCATCQQSVCICTKGTYSNGATCMPATAIILNKARNGCDQYGSPCKFHLSSARRKPLFAPIGNNTTNPLYYNVAGERYCISDSTNDIDPDSTCLPSEKCIDGKCRMKLWPGEYGCRSDLECSSRCPNTYCEEKSDKNVAQCQCRNGLLLYGRCFEACPKGFHESGAYCMHDDEEAFWENSDAQENLQQLLNDGTC